MRGHVDVFTQVVITNEDHKVWRGYLAKGQYDTALLYCRDLGQREQVLRAQADYYFDCKQSELAASIYAKTKLSFEHVALKLLATGEKEPIKRYLSDKLDHIKATDTAQLTMLCTWLTEIYLDKLNAASAAENPDEYQAVLEEVRQVIEDHVKSLDPATTYQLMLHHGRLDVLLYYAELQKDYHRVISHHMQRRDWTKALQVLVKSNDVKLYYLHAPTLMQHAPVGTTNALINATRSSSFALEPRKLLPALMRYDARTTKTPAAGTAAVPGAGAGAAEGGGAQGNQALRFLLHCVKNLKCKDPVVTKRLVSMLAKQPDDSLMLSFLNDVDTAGAAGAGGSGGGLDLHYCYRACQAAGKQEACVTILSMMGQYSEAVQAALAIGDLQLAKINADMVGDDEQLRKQLWLRIARMVVEQTGDVRAAMALISDTQRACPLKVEDVLPLLADFAVIDDLKDAICASLEDYQRQIQQLKCGMEDATRTSELIRKDMTQLRSRFGFVKSSDTCRLCCTPVLSSGLYLFPCQHALHMHCVEVYMMEHGGLSAQDKTRVQQVKAALDAAQRQAQDRGRAGKADGEGGAAPVDQARLQAELDDLLASDCPICGIPAIKLLDRPLPPVGDGPRLWDLPDKSG